MIEGERNSQHNPQITPITNENENMTHQDEIPPITMPKRPANWPIPPLQAKLDREHKKPTDFACLGNPNICKPSVRYEAELEAEREHECQSIKEVERMVKEEDAGDIAGFAWKADDSKTDHSVPKNLREAWASPEWEKWQEAMREEYDQLINMGTWELQQPVEGQRLVGNHWVFAKKYDEHASGKKILAS